jgi:hypothetical protein
MLPGARGVKLLGLRPAANLELFWFAASELNHRSLLDLPQRPAWQVEGGPKGCRPVLPLPRQSQAFECCLVPKRPIDDQTAQQQIARVSCALQLEPCYPHSRVPLFWVVGVACVLWIYAADVSCWIRGETRVYRPRGLYFLPLFDASWLLDNWLPAQGPLSKCLGASHAMCV